MTVEVSGETSGRRSYLPGAWFGVFGEHATVLLPPSEKRRVAALWELLDDGADFDEVLDALIATGLRDLPGFVLVSDTDVEGAVTARVVVRGDARVSFETTDGPVEVVAAGAGTWVERTVPGVTSTVLDVSTDGDGEGVAGEPMTVTGGLVRVSRVESPPPVAGTGVDTDPMDLPAAGSEAAAPADGGHDDLAPSDRPVDAPADSSEQSEQSGWSPAVVAGTAVGAAGVAGAAGALGAQADDERSAGADTDAADQWPYAETPAPAEPEPALEPEPSPEPSPEPLAEGDPATEASDLPRSEPVDALDPAAPIEHHDEPAAHEPAPADDAVGEPTEMMSFDELAAESEAPPSDDSFDQGADQGVEQGSFLDKPADESASGGWAPAEPAPQDGPPPAPDFGSGAAPAGPQWSPPPAPSNPFASAPPAGGAPDPYGTPDQQQGWDQQGGFEQAAGFEPPQSSPSQEAPEQGGWGEPSPGWGEPAAAPSPGWGEPAPAAHDDVDHDGDTRAGDYDPEVYARSQPGIPGQPPAPSVTARPVARLMMSHGETVDVDRAILVGRAPEARRFTATEQPRLVTVPSPNQEISSTHLEVRPGSGADHGSAVVTDMGSTNGTVLIQPGLAPEDLQPGIAVQLIPGAVIDLGDGLTIQVANP